MRRREKKMKRSSGKEGQFFVNHTHTVAGLGRYSIAKKSRKSLKKQLTHSSTPPPRPAAREP